MRGFTSLWLRVLITFICLSGGLVAISKVFAAITTFRGEVSKVTDGDTIHFRDYDASPNAPDLKIRMVHIDAPEQHLPTKDQGVVGQGPWGDAATKYLDSLTPVGTKVTLVSLGFDKYHRVLGRFYYGKRNVNLQMVRAGQAVPYVICEGPICNRDFFEREEIKTYLDACDEAREAGRGIFNPKHPLKELPYQFRLRMQKREADKLIGDFDTRKLHEPTEFNEVDVCRRIFFLKEADARRAGFNW